MRKVIGNGRSILEVLLLLVVSVAWALPTAVAPADAQRYLNDIKTLTQPNMEGRGEGTKGSLEQAVCRGCSWPANGVSMTTRLPR